MNLVERIFNLPEIVEGSQWCLHEEHAVALEWIERRKRGRFTVAEVRKDQADCFMCRIGSQAQAFGACSFGGAFCAASGWVVLPAVIEAAQLLPFHGSGGQ